MKIPHFEMPGDNNGKKFIDEELIDIQEYFGDAIITEPQYFLQNIKGSIDKCLVRKTLIEKIETAMSLLPKGITFKVYDAWRPITVQRALFDKCNNKNFVSPPSDDIESPPVHNSGGAIDLTLFDKSTNTELNMGTKFDSMTEKAATDYYEITGSDDVRVNRRLLYVAMINAGFTNLPSEWWHYDYGDAFWSYYTGKPMLYKGIPDNMYR